MEYYKINYFGTIGVIGNKVNNIPGVKFEHGDLSKQIEVLTEYDKLYLPKKLHELIKRMVSEFIDCDLLDTSGLLISDKFKGNEVAKYIYGYLIPCEPVNFQYTIKLDEDNLGNKVYKVDSLSDEVIKNQIKLYGEDLASIYEINKRVIIAAFSKDKNKVVDADIRSIYLGLMKGIEDIIG